jgi:hypothetical protein
MKGLNPLANQRDDGYLLARHSDHARRHGGAG